MIKLYGKWGRQTGSMCPVLKFWTKIDTVISVCLNRQLQLDDLVAQCLGLGLFCYLCIIGLIRLDWYIG